MWRAMLAVAILLAGCAQLPPTPQDIQAKRFEPVPDKAVIYIARATVDSPNAGTIVLGNVGTITTHPRTYYRWEVAPGTHRIEGFGPSTATANVRAEAGKIYYVQHTVHGGIRDGVRGMSIQQISEDTGRRLVNSGQLL